MKSIGFAIWNTLTTFLKWIVENVCGVSMSESKWESIQQFIKFGIVGLTNTLIAYIIYIISLRLLEQANLFMQYDYLVAQFISFLISVAWSFYWNRKYVFDAEKNQQTLLKSLMKTYISYGFTGIVLNSFLLFVWIDILNINKFIAPIINLVITVPLNFLLNKFWAFKK